MIKSAFWFIADVEMCLFFLVGFIIVILTGVFHAEFGSRSWMVWQVGYSIMFLCAFNVGRMLFLYQTFYDLYQAQERQLYLRDVQPLLLRLVVAVALLVASVVVVMPRLSY
jgi:hypothetical protein